MSSDLRREHLDAVWQGPGSYNQSPRLGEGPKYTASGKRGGSSDAAIVGRI